MKKLYKTAILLVAISLLATTTMFVLANETDFYNENNSEELESPYVVDVTGILDHLFEPFEPIVIDASFFDTIEDYVQFREAERLMTVQAFYKRLTGYDAPITFKQVEFSVNEVMDFGIQFVESIDVNMVG